MTNSLYTEALADAKAIREAAETRAKQQLVESMSPQIKLMVEQAILGEGEDQKDPKDGEEEAADDEEKVIKDNAKSTHESSKVSEDPFEEAPYENKEPVEFDEDMSAGEGDLVDVDVETDEVTVESKKLINKLITKKQRKHNGKIYQWNSKG